MRLKEIMLAAERNAQERLLLVKELERKLGKDQYLRKRVDNVDGSFLRKIFRFQGDITSHRIATVLRKIGE
jgi:hypothetical protein